ncbi:MAG: NB-Dependent Receptor Plug [Mucilaginibacter sp.]|nr:NB-Dependent Receptor Plug [Mucilaginibacter sp.]
MYKFYYTNGNGVTRRSLQAQHNFFRIDTWNITFKKWLMRINLVCLITLTVFLQISFAAKAQKISLSKTRAPLAEIFKEIRKQCGFDFLINEDQIKLSKAVSIHVKDMELTDVLNVCFKDQPFYYTLTNKLIIVVPKKADTKDDSSPTSANIMPRAQIDVQGKVLDDQGNPLYGITVSVKGANTTTATDKDGLFSIKAVNAQDVLIFKSIGMETLEVNINGRKYISVSLKTSITSLGEVRINTGYQTLRKEQMTGSAVTVTGAELEERYIPNIISNLEGRVPGLVNYNGSTTIRGVSTINAGKDPLYVVDGLPIDGSIANINPYDVESITVLKDAAATSIYGSRASNGIIVVTTKKAKNHRTTVEVNTNISITDKPNISYNLLPPSDQVDLESSYYSYYYKSVAGAASLTATNITNGNPITPVQYAYYQLAQGTIIQSTLDARLAGFKQNDFRKQYSDNALLKTILQQYDLAVRTDGDKFNSSLVVDYKNNNGGIINSFSRQLNMFYRGSYQMSKWMDVNFGVNNILGQSNSSNSSFATSVTNVSPYLQLLDASGNKAYYTTGDYNMYNTTTASMPQYSMLVNHLDELALDRAKVNQQNGRYFVNLNARIIPGLSFSPQFQYENTTSSSSAYSEQESYIMRYLDNVYYKVPTVPATTPATYINLLPVNGGKLATSNSSSNSWTARGQLNYKRQFGKSNIDVIGGTEFRNINTKGANGLLLGYDDQLQNQQTTTVNFPALFAYATSTTFKPGFGTTGLYNTYFSNPISLIPETTHRTNSGYGSATYTYDNKYAAFGSYRVDYADVFGLDPKFRGSPLWSSGLAWNVSNESFMTKVNWVNFLKLRVSYGVTGNLKKDLNSYLVANSTLPPNAATNAPVSVVTQAANPDLRWEKSATFNMGIDFTLFNNRLNGSLDWYRKTTTDLLFNTRIDPSEGFTTQTINNGGLVNNGIELMLNYNWIKPVSKSDISWSSMLTLSHNENKITYVDAIATTPALLVGGGYKVGYPVNSLFSYQYKGLSTVGQPQWLKADGTLTTVAMTSANDLNALVYSGGTDPINVIGLTNTVYYKGFSLNVLAMYYGGQYLRANAPDVYQSGASYGSMPSYLLKSWTPGNTTTNIPGFGQYAPGNYAGTAIVPSGYLANSDTFVQPGDFIKIRSVVLGYQLPQLWTSKLGAKNVRLIFQLNNPKALWLKNNVGVDPETGGASVPTSYVFGLNFNL